jgi:predicted phage terminase large subunit-like protein
MSEHQRVLDAVLRRDLASFIAKSFHTVAPAQPFHRNWHLEAIAWRLEQCLTGEVRRLIITLPPRNLKSVSASVAFPAFALGQDPTKRIVCVSYSSELSGKHARDCRAVMDSTWYRRVFPMTRLSREKNAELDFMTTQRGYRLSTSVGGTLTGRGGSLVIVDDPMKPDEAMSEARRRSACDWFENTLYSRLDDKRSDVIILIMQRLHIDDLVGHVLEKEDWVQLNLPAIAEVEERIPIGPDKLYHRMAGEPLHGDREPLEVLEELRRSLGSFHFSAQYQQSPVPLEGELIKWEWFQVYDSEPGREPNDKLVQSWDTASKAGELNDYTVCTTWLIKGKDFFLLDLFRDRLNYPDLKRAIELQALRFRPDSVLIEDKASGMALIQDLRQHRVAAIGLPIAIEPEGDKVTRAAAQSAAIETGWVHLPRRASWLGELRTEILQFPYGRHDDQVDSIAQFLKWAQDRSRNVMRVIELKGWY